MKTKWKPDYKKTFLTLLVPAWLNEALNKKAEREFAGSRTALVIEELCKSLRGEDPRAEKLARALEAQREANGEAAK